MTLQSPVKKIFVTQVFGVNPASYAKFGYKGHNGIDFRAFLPNGNRASAGGVSEVFAPHGGKVIENALDSNGYGWYIKIEDAIQGSTLAHFSHQSPCKVGETVNIGQFVGFQGTTGNSTGIHLHWGYYKHPRNRSNGYGGYINQEGLYAPYKETMQDQYGDMVWKSTQHDETVRSIFDPNKDPRQTSSGDILAVVSGYKSQATDLRNKLATAEQEVANRIEQVGRLNEQLTKQAETYEARLIALKTDAKAIEKLEQEYLGKLSQLQTQVDEMAKDKGKALLRVSVLEAENKDLKDRLTAPLSIGDLLGLIIKKLFERKV
jgi:hypothetical protein